MMEGQDRFAAAQELFEKGDLEIALAAFVSIAGDARWLARCEIYIARIVGLLQSRLERGSEEWQRLESVLMQVQGRLEKVALPRAASRPRPAESASRPRPRSRLLVGTKEGPMPSLARTSDFRVERTPHIDVIRDSPLEPDDRFKIRVYLDKLPMRPGEIGQGIAAPAGTRIEMTLVASSQLAILGPDSASFILNDVSGVIELPLFELVVRPKAEWQSDGAGVIAIFFIDGRPCGKVSRRIPLGRVDAATDATVQRIVVVPNGVVPADLTVTVVADIINNGRQFQCTVTTPHIEKYSQAKAQPWNLSDSTSAVVRGYMEKFTSASTGPEQLIDELNGAGKKLFDASPKLFQEVFWALSDAGLPLRSIAIVSEEPYFPWELMIPRRRSKNGLEEFEKSLGVLFGVGRWTSPDIVSPTRDIELNDSFVIAPNYNGRGDLRNAAAEAKMVASLFDGEMISPASFAQIRMRLLGQARSLIHFVCHGNSAAFENQSLRLEGNEVLTSSSLIGINGLAKIFSAKKPVVFLNACEVGRGIPSLVGLGGFAPAFIELGASAVIAPLWSVDDEIAHRIAEEFYREVRKKPSVPLSRIFSAIRAKAYVEGKDTYAAYCFFGDPLASMAESRTILPARPGG
ncbi:hypothetical protein V1279_006607 [Bradyrhizobium sp. AZCC 1610]|uniref:CHAT domain-containing protein n=1 Tax=Bradyrhizobium sp. AZCC 1610 TaxID=3117020 RepID=UPI002FF2A12F